jgi:chromate transport protein ChrA
VDTYETARLATGILGILMLAGVLAFLVLYWRMSRWRETSLGRHMMYFMIALACVLVVRTCRYFWEDVTWLVYAGLFTYALLVLVIWQRVYLLVRSLREVED